MQDTSVFLRFKDLQARGIVRARSTLTRYQQVYDFPKGRLLGGARVWTEAEINDWLDSRPKENPAALRDGRGRLLSGEAA